MPVLLAVDQGTTSSRAVVYDPATFAALGSAQQELEQHYPRDGWVEHEPEDIWYSVARTVREALTAAGRAPAEVAAVGITNQRETVVVWDRATGRPVHRAVVWQDRRTTAFCRDRAADGPMLAAKTGLVLDPYFSATKLAWLLDNVSGLRPAAERGELAAGTVDSFLLWRLTGGQAHLTDASNASRTLLYDIHRMRWDDELLRYFGVPQAVLPEVKPSAAAFGVTKGLDFLPDGVPVRGIAGDQQAALFGQRCFAPGEGKCTYGTGAFLLLHTGDRPVPSAHRLLTTVAATTDDKPRYALEGAVFVAGAAVQWLRDGLRLFRAAADVEELARGSDPAGGVVFVPGFVGLGAPHWVPEARGAVFGLTRATSAADLGRAALEGVAFQVADLIEAADKDLASGGREPPDDSANPERERGGGESTPSLALGVRPESALKVDGGMARNDWFLQCQADLLGRPVVRAAQAESTALGAAMLAAVGAGLADEASLAGLAAGGTRFDPAMPAADRDRKLALWRRAVRATVAFAGSAPAASVS